MFKLYLSVIISFLIFSLTARADESEKKESQKINLDIYGYTGYRLMTLKDKDVFGRSPNLSGGNLTVGALYTFQTKTKIKPVAGLALEGAYVTGDYYNDGRVDVKYSYSTITANGGIKYNINDSFSVIGLAGIGTSFRDEYEYKRDLIIGDIKTKTSVSNHYIYGVNLMGLYRFGNLFSMGANATFNVHTMEQKYEALSADLTYYERSLNLLFMWSI
ncbi:hypothetical protein QEJ31_10225 [Pigmentibacter sp. JX0631]|uniref:transporter n=1 Tax=Pigmentibacter sp. JX0631 TaxID=2976982 RepID=UPI0024695246|nr:transporter [Pigmentibacter sp. JX0631]WGL58898.1 hypothetical protein QEJ31_10225 [Pigmentibacter sp. JX0631]